MKDETREATWPLVGSFVLFYAAWSAAVNLGFRANVPFLGTLTANLAGLMLLVVGLLFLVGRLRPRDVGLVPTDLRNGVFYTISSFVLIQVGVAAASVATGAGVVNDWIGYGALATVSLLVAQLLGNALLEEIAFRGFLLRQLFRKLHRSGAAALVLAAREPLPAVIPAPVGPIQPAEFPTLEIDQAALAAALAEDGRADAKRMRVRRQRLMAAAVVTLILTGGAGALAFSGREGDSGMLGDRTIALSTERPTDPAFMLPGSGYEPAGADDPNADALAGAAADSAASPATNSASGAPSVSASKAG